MGKKTKNILLVTIIIAAIWSLFKTNSSPDIEGLKERLKF
jgi:hypothetical protein